MEDTIGNISGKLTTNEYVMNCYVHIYNYMYFVLKNGRNILQILQKVTNKKLSRIDSLPE